MKRIAMMSVVLLCFCLTLGSFVACTDTGTTIDVGAGDGLVFGTHVGSAAYKKLGESKVCAGAGEQEGFVVVQVAKDVTMVDVNLRPYFDGKNVLGSMFSYTRQVGDEKATKGHAFEPMAAGENSWRKHSLPNEVPVAQSAMKTHAVFAGVLDANAPTGTVSRWSTYIGQASFNQNVVYNFRGHDGNTYVLKVFVKQ